PVSLLAQAQLGVHLLYENTCAFSIGSSRCEPNHRNCASLARVNPRRIAAPRRGAQIPVAMTIAGTDPSGGAGLQADLKTFAALKVYGLSVITTVIAQNSAQVTRVETMEPGMVAAQLETMVSERMPDALKIGALGSARIARIVATSVESLGLPPPVLD